MPTAALPPVPHWNSIKPTGEQLEWAELEVIDLARAKMPIGRAEQVEKARDAMHKQGFFYVINHGLDKAQVRKLGICNLDSVDVDSAVARWKGYLTSRLSPFEQVSSEEKKRYANRRIGASVGYKPLRSHPEAVRPLLPEIQEFVRHNHIDILHEIQRLLTLGLELPV
ncbi:hypothetical protein BC827DRAFT_374549 [Russula dissimulans]|nr:hypothetical protein BC827DRAFT_374549 [Russula dissimulans]